MIGTVRPVVAKSRNVGGCFSSGAAPLILDASICISVPTLSAHRLFFPWPWAIIPAEKRRYDFILGRTFWHNALLCDTIVLRDNKLLAP